MTKEFEALMRLVGAAALGQRVTELPDDLDWQKIEKLAGRQCVQTLVGYALRLSPGLACPQEIRTRMIADMRRAAFSNNAWKTSVFGLLKEMNDVGIEALLLKGYAVADCYAAPDCRLSGDTDLLIDPKDEKRACKFMQSKGFGVNPRWENGHHAVCSHPQIGCVELHVQLYDEIVEEVWFGRTDGSEFVKEQPMTIELADGSCRTLGYTDHFVFLVLHMIKHFILSGLTIQMMLDVALYFKKHAERIDVDRLWDMVNRLSYGKLLNSILWAMIRYCGFNAGDFQGICAEAPAEMAAVLDDLEAGGWMGTEDKAARGEGWDAYNRQLLMKDKSGVQYWLYMIRWKSGMLKSALFPGINKIGKQYPCVKKYPALLPLVWVYRLFNRGFRSIRNGLLTSHIVMDEDSISAKAKDRIALFRKLNIM